MNDPKELLEGMLEKQRINSQAIQNLQAELKERTDLQLRLSGAVEALTLLNTTEEESE